MGLAQACFVGVLLFACGCTHSEVKQSGALDPGARSIAVRAHKNALSKAIAQTLASAGWRVVADRTGADKADGTRYRLLLTACAIDYCHGGRIYIYEIAIVDNRTGSRVLEQSGRECGHDIARKFGDVLRAQPRS